MSLEKDILLKIGLSQNESDIYLILLSQKELSAYEIAQKIGMHRPRVYDKLETLMKKGLVSQIKKGSKMYFRAANPNKLNDFLDEKIEKIEEEKTQLEKILPNLISQNLANKDEFDVEVYKGKEGLKGFLKDIVRTKENISVMGLDEEYYKTNIPIYIEKYFNGLKENKIKERAIISDKPNVFTFKNKTTKYRKLKSESLNPTNIYLYGKKVGFIFWGNPIFILKIENKNMAKTYQEHFEYLWRLAKK